MSEGQWIEVNSKKNKKKKESNILDSKTLIEKYQDKRDMRERCRNCRNPTPYREDELGLELKYSGWTGAQNKELSRLIIPFLHGHQFWQMEGNPQCANYLIFFWKEAARITETVWQRIQEFATQVGLLITHIELRINFGDWLSMKTHAHIHVHWDHMKETIHLFPKEKIPTNKEPETFPNTDTEERVDLPGFNLASYSDCVGALKLFRLVEDARKSLSMKGMSLKICYKGLEQDSYLLLRAGEHKEQSLGEIKRKIVERYNDFKKGQGTSLPGHSKGKEEDNQ